MELQVSRKDLEEAYTSVKGCTVGQGSMVTAHVLFRPTVAGGYELLATNQRNFGSTPVGGVAVVGDAVPFTIENKRLEQWLKAVPADATVTFVVAGDEAARKVTAKTTAGKVSFDSLNPTRFPYWDAKLTECKVTSTMPASRLAGLLGHARNFISDQEHRMPHLCVAQARTGALYSTDQTVVSMITSAALAACDFRIHYKDIGSLVTFLRAAGDDPIEVLEHESFCAMRRGDTALVAATRFSANFPTLSIDKDGVDQQWWAVNREKLLSSIRYVAASAAYDDKRLTLRRDGDKLKLQMKAASGDVATIDVALEGHELTTGNADVEFCVSSDHITKVLTVLEDDVVKMGINQHKDAGWVRLREERDGDDYLTILTWMPKA